MLVPICIVLLGVALTVVSIACEETSGHKPAAVTPADEDINAWLLRVEDEAVMAAFQEAGLLGADDILWGSIPNNLLKANQAL